MATAAQRGMNARAALEAAVAYYDSRNPVTESGGTAQLLDVKNAAAYLADWLDSRTKEARDVG